MKPTTLEWPDQPSATKPEPISRDRTVPIFCPGSKVNRGDDDGDREKPLRTGRLGQGSRPSGWPAAI